MCWIISNGDDVNRLSHLLHFFSWLCSFSLAHRWCWQAARPCPPSPHSDIERNYRGRQTWFIRTMGLSRYALHLHTFSSFKKEKKKHVSVMYIDLQPPTVSDDEVGHRTRVITLNITTLTLQWAVTPSYSGWRGPEQRWLDHLPFRNRRNGSRQRD